MNESYFFPILTKDSPDKKLLASKAPQKNEILETIKIEMEKQRLNQLEMRKHIEAAEETIDDIDSVFPNSALFLELESQNTRPSIANGLLSPRIFFNSQF